MPDGKWNRIDSAPGGREVLLAWTGEGRWRNKHPDLDWIWTKGELVDGEYLDADWGRPDWWMDNPPCPPDMH